MTDSNIFSTLQCRPVIRRGMMKYKNWATIVKILDTEPTTIPINKIKRRKRLIPRKAINENDSLTIFPLICQSQIKKKYWGSTMIRPLKAKSRLAELIKHNTSLNKRPYSIIPKFNHKILKEQGNNITILKPRRDKLLSRARLKHNSETVNKILRKDNIDKRIAVKNKMILGQRLECDEEFSNTMLHQVYK